MRSADIKKQLHAQGLDPFLDGQGFISYGWEAAKNSIKNFNPEKGEFEPFATSHAKYAIENMLKSGQSLEKTPKLRKLYYDAVRRGLPFDAKRLAEEFEITPEDAKRLVDAYEDDRRPLSLDAPSGEGRTLGDRTPAPDAKTSHDLVQLGNAIEEALNEIRLDAMEEIIDQARLLPEFADLDRDGVVEKLLSRPEILPMLKERVDERIAAAQQKTLEDVLNGNKLDMLEPEPEVEAAIEAAEEDASPKRGPQAMLAEDPQYAQARKRIKEAEANGTEREDKRARKALEDLIRNAPETDKPPTHTFAEHETAVRTLLDNHTIMDNAEKDVAQGLITSMQRAFAKILNVDPDHMLSFITFRSDIDLLDKLAKSNDRGWQNPNDKTIVIAPYEKAIVPIHEMLHGLMDVLLYKDAGRSMLRTIADAMNYDYSKPHKAKWTPDHAEFWDNLNNAEKNYRRTRNEFYYLGGQPGERLAFMFGDYLADVTGDDGFRHSRFDAYKSVYDKALSEGRASTEQQNHYNPRYSEALAKIFKEWINEFSVDAESVKKTDSDESLGRGLASTEGTLGERGPYSGSHKPATEGQRSFDRASDVPGGGDGGSVGPSLGGTGEAGSGKAGTSRTNPGVDGRDTEGERSGIVGLSAEERRDADIHELDSLLRESPKRKPARMAQAPPLSGPPPTVQSVSDAWKALDRERFDRWMSGQDALGEFGEDYNIRDTIGAWKTLGAKTRAALVDRAAEFRSWVKAGSRLGGAF